MEGSTSPFPAMANRLCRLCTMIQAGSREWCRGFYTPRTVVTGAQVVKLCAVFGDLTPPINISGPDMSGLVQHQQ